MDIYRLKELREKNLITQETVANFIGMDESTYRHYENNDYTIPIKHLIKTCDFFNTSLDFALGFVKDEKYVNQNCNYDIDLYCIRIKNLRKNINFTQKDLANLLGISRQNITNYEKGTVLIPTSYLYEICKRYSISADYLLGRIDFIPDWCNKQI